jgi:hypothetical protein
MDPNVYYVLHVGSLLLWSGVIFRAIADPRPENKRGAMIRGGVASLVALVAGFGLLAKLEYGFPNWILAKIGCWVGLTILVSLAYRKGKGSHVYAWLASVLLAGAVYLVYYRPF